MFVIQSGLVEITHTFDKGKGEFIIEKLYRGSVVNHNSFLMNDGIDTNAICRNTTSIFYIHINKITEMRQKYMELDQALQAQERILLNPKGKEPALDYIICDPYNRTQYWYSSKNENKFHNFESEERRRKLTVKLKNLIMAVWIDVKR